MSLNSRIKKLGIIKDKILYQLERAQRRRLIAGLLVFLGLILSQVIPGLHLEWISLLLPLPAFAFYFVKSRRLHGFVDSLLELENFYIRQSNFQEGAFTENEAKSLEMHNPELARDLDLNVLLGNLDYCFSRQGQALLNRWLCQDFTETTTQDRQKQMKELLQAPGLLRRVQKQKVKSETNFDRIGTEVHRSFFPKPLTWKWMIPITWLLLVTFLFVPAPGLLWKLVLLSYIGFMLSYLNHTAHLFSRLQDLHKDFEGLQGRIGIYEQLARRLSYTPSLQKANASNDVKKIARFISLVSLRTNPILFYILNMILPWDFLIAELCERQRKIFQANFSNWSQEVIHLEALGSLINLKLYHKTVWPKVISDSENVGFVNVKELSHPLLDQTKVITNSFAAGDCRVVIVTGSNMSGKSTFLRALGINLCLANIGAPVFAKHMSFKPMTMKTCIRVSDSLRDGQSYFYAEVQRMKNILEDSKTKEVFFLIDEPLRGTNNKERLAGNQSYLSQILESHGQGFLCTHDLELTKLAQSSPAIANYHFSDTWQDKELFFDYKIKEGPSTSTNALKILEKEGLYRESPINPG